METDNTFACHLITAVISTPLEPPTPPLTIKRKEKKKKPTHMDTNKADFQYSMLSLSLPPDHKAPAGTKDGGLNVFVS